MAEKRVLIFAGTTEGRMLVKDLAGHGVRVHACAATEYGASLLPEGGSVTVSAGRMDEGQMERLMQEFGPDYVVDATHPYADEVSRNAREACSQCRRTYLRLVREGSRTDGCVYAKDIRAAVEYLSGTDGNILAATGSKEIEEYTRLKDYKERLYARVLSVAGVTEKCEQLGIRGRHLICMQGPFSAEMNAALLREYQIAWFVTKESGKAGGFPEKYEAARRAGTKLVVIGRPEEEDGYTLEEMRGILKKKLGLSGQDHGRRRKVTLVGIGTGRRDYFTVRAEEVFRQADLIIGAKRTVKAAAVDGQDIFFSYRPEEIAAYLSEHPEYRHVAVALSGDVGFYSGAKKLLSALSEVADTADTEVVPGISSVVYFCAKLHLPWEDAALVSMHGKKARVISTVRDHEKTIVLAEGRKGIRRLGAQMKEYGYGGLQVWVGESLSYEDEKIRQFTAEELSAYGGSDLAVLYIRNPEGKRRRLGGIADALFVRGNVPMTKEEVRSVSIAKLCLNRDSVVFDIGAGTGSVAVEAALRAVGGTVFAVEAKEEAAELIAQNQRKFKTDNLCIIQGEAPEALEGLPAADCVFIGGSGGRLKEILSMLTDGLKDRAGDAGSAGAGGRHMHVVINAISLETVAEAVQCLRELKERIGIRVDEEEIVQISAARSKQMGDYHLMMGQNPVSVISVKISAAVMEAEG